MPADAVVDVRAAGYTERQMIGTILAISVITFTNLVSRVDDTTLDFPAVQRADRCRGVSGQPAAGPARVRPRSSARSVDVDQSRNAASGRLLDIPQATRGPRPYRFGHDVHAKETAMRDNAPPATAGRRAAGAR